MSRKNQDTDTRRWTDKLQTVATALGFGITAAALVGCCVVTGPFSGVSTISESQGTAFQGRLHGGQLGIAGASIQLWAAVANGYGQASQPLLKTPVISDANGNFNIPANYVCPSSITPVYLAAVGGDAGYGKNPNVVLMAAIGDCGNFSSSTPLVINELSTVALTYALAPFMTSFDHVGSPAANVAGMRHAFATAGRLVDLGTGTSPGKLPSGATAPVETLNALADMLSACVETTGGTALDGSACGTLFSAVTGPGANAPRDTAAAALLIAKHPAQNVAALFQLVPSKPEFQPVPTTSPGDLTLAIKYKPRVSHPSAAALDAEGNLWIANAGNNSVSVIDTTGTPLPGSPYTGGGLQGPSALALDAGGNAWVTNQANSTLTVLSPTGVATQTAALGLQSPVAIAVDRSGLLWVANNGNSTISAITVSGTSVTSSTAYSTGSLTAPAAVAVNPF